MIVHYERVLKTTDCAGPTPMMGFIQSIHMSCTYLAHHELESVKIIIIIVHMCSRSTRYTQYASCQKASPGFAAVCKAMYLHIAMDMGKAYCSLEGLKTVQQQHAATCGQARFDITRLDLPLCHLCPNIGQVA